MRKQMMLAAAAFAALGFTGLTSSGALAAGCLNPRDLPPMSLTHDDMVPNAGFGYNKQAYQDQLARGNTCGVTQQSYRTDQDPYQSYPNRPGGGGTAFKLGNGNN
ncbi:MAG TPA: hypothetical protein VHB74_15055 [Devosia sp.]|nr:hypothetical protein [Devosia sp.]